MKGRIALASIAALLLAAWYVPRISADRYRGPIHQALEAAVGRQVEMGAVKFRLLPKPGFTVENVRIGEDPAIGLEPLAYITTLRATPRLSSLFGGTLAFYSVDLEEASVNLTRVEKDNRVLWNSSSLLRPALLQTFPSIHMNNGRVNFKIGDTKSIFYLLNTDVDLWPPSSAEGAWSFRLRTESARTDSPARGFGSFTGRGEWRQRDSSVTLDMKLEKSQIGELLTFFAGHDTGLRGQVSGEAHFAGPISRVGVRAHLALANVHNWELPPPDQTAWPISVGGVINVPGQSIQLQATGDKAPVDIRYRVTELAGRPRWGVMAYFAKLPIAPLLAVARNLGGDVPADMKLAGTMEGAVGYSTVDGSPRVDGQIQIADATLGVAKTPPLTVGMAQVNFVGVTASLAPAIVTNERGDTAELSGAYNVQTGKVTFGLSTTGMEIGSLRSQISVAGAPILAQATSGIWRGDLHFEDGWTGNLQLENADVSFQAFAAPVRILKADAVLEKTGLTIKKLEASVGGVQVSGDYRYDAMALRPHRFHLTFDEVEAASLEALLAPVLKRGNFFSYAFVSRKAPQPDWLRDMRADGTVTINTLRLLDFPLTKVRTRVVWDGTQAKFAGLSASVDRSLFAGDAAVDLHDRQPAYRVAGVLKNMPWHSGQITAEGEATASGFGSDLWSALEVKGSFRGKGLDFSPLDVYSVADGCFAWVGDNRYPKLKLSQLALTGSEGTLVGSGEGQDDGQITLHLSDGSRQVISIGSLAKGGGLRASSGQ